MMDYPVDLLRQSDISKPCYLCVAKQMYGVSDTARFLPTHLSSGELHTVCLLLSSTRCCQVTGVRSAQQLL